VGIDGVELAGLELTFTLICSGRLERFTIHIWEKFHRVVTRLSVIPSRPWSVALSKELVI
jgi:hypothetical protein